MVLAKELESYLDLESHSVMYLEKVLEYHLVVSVMLLVYLMVMEMECY